MVRILLIAALCATVSSGQQTQTGAIAGTVTDTSGGVLPGVTITLVGPKSAKAVTSARGEYRIDDLIVGEYRVEATLPGFRKGLATVTVQEGVTTKANITLRLGLLSIVDYIMPKDGVQGAVREAAVVAQIRLTGIARTRLAEGESLIVTDHDSTVLTVVKADAPGIVPGSSLRFGQNNAGLWVEEGYRAVGLERPYSPGDSFVAFLMRDKDSSLREYRGEWYMWPVKQGFVVIETPGPLSGLRSPMPVDEAISVLRKLLSTAHQVQTGAVTGTVTDASGGGTLPGVTVKWYGQKTGEVVTNSRGDYRIDALAPGPYRLEFALAGFRRGMVDVVVEPGRTTDAQMRLRLGIMTTHGLIVEFPFSKVLSDVPVIAYLRITKPVGPHLLYDANLATEHEAIVLDVVKTDDSGIATGSTLRFSQLYAGFWIEDGRTYTGESRPYLANQPFVALLRRSRDGRLVEHAGPRHMYPVSTDGRVTIGAVSASPMAVSEALAALRKLLVPKNREPR